MDSYLKLESFAANNFLLTNSYSMKIFVFDVVFVVYDVENKGSETEAQRFLLKRKFDIRFHSLDNSKKFETHKARIKKAMIPTFAKIVQAC